MGRAWVRALRQEALTEQKGHCYYCMSRLTARTATAEHKRPRSKGGKDTRTNVAACCEACNATKGNMSEGQFWSAIKKPPGPTTPIEITMAWSRRKIGLRTKKACERIDRLVGRGENAVPVARPANDNVASVATVQELRLQRRKARHTRARG